MKKFLILTLIIAVTISAAAVMAYNPGGYSKEETAENSLHEFLGDQDQSVKFACTEKNHYGDYYKFSSEDGGEYYVDADTCTVSRAEFSFDWAVTNKVKISIEEAEKKARQFISEKSSLFDSSTIDITESGLLDHGGYKEYKFVFREVRDGVLLFKSAIISVSPSSGDIISYMSVDKKLEVSLLPEISEEKAIDLAISQFEGIQVVNTEAQLIIDYPGGKEQKLLWNIIIEGEPENYVLQGGSVIIDAVTGEVYTKSVVQ